MKFREEVKVVQSENQITADNLDYFNLKGLINILMVDRYWKKFL